MARETPPFMANVILDFHFFWNPSLILGHGGAKGKKKAPDSDKEPVGTVHMHSVFLREQKPRVASECFIQPLNFYIFIPPT